jgi:hypothetical protein
MRIAFLNLQGNFDPEDCYWTEHPDFGGQLVYVKRIALAMGELGHQVDILTRKIIDPDWPEFSDSLDLNYNPRIWPDKVEAREVLAQIMPCITIVNPSLNDARLLFDPNMSETGLEAACKDRFHDLGAEVVIVTRSGGIVTISTEDKVERVGPLPLVAVDSVIGGSDAFWGGLLVAHLDEKTWKEAVCFAHKVAALKLQNVSHVEQLVDKELLYNQVEETLVQL